MLNNREVDTVAQGKADFDGANLESPSEKEDKGDGDGTSQASSVKPEQRCVAGKSLVHPRRSRQRLTELWSMK